MMDSITSRLRPRLHAWRATVVWRRWVLQILILRNKGRILFLETLQLVRRFRIRFYLFAYSQDMPLYLRRRFASVQKTDNQVNSFCEVHASDGGIVEEHRQSSVLQSKSDFPRHDGAGEMNERKNGNE